MNALGLRTGLTVLAIATTAPVFAADQALVIGIDDYPGLSLAVPLTGAVADARNFADFLTDKMGFAAEGITLLTGAEASADAIMQTIIDRLVGQSASGDRVVFYFAGLGSRLTIPGAEPTDVLLAHDAPGILGNLPRDTIADILDLLAERQVTVVIDASFRSDATDLTGTLATGRSVALDANGSGGTALSADPFGMGETERAVWNAAAPDQFAWETSGQGVFTRLFIDALGNDAADANGNGTISNSELLTHLRARSEEWCRANADCGGAGGALIPNFSGPLQDAALEAAKAAPPAQTRPEEKPLPVSALAEKNLNLSDTLGFVTDLFTPSNGANLRLELSQDGPLKVGDIVSFTATATAERPGTLVLLDVNPKGELAQVFPSSLARNGATRMQAGETLTIPNGNSADGVPLTVRVTEPAGAGFLLGLFIEDDLPRLTAILPENLEGGPVPNAGQYLYEIAQDLLRLQADGSGSAATEWSATYLPYEIIP
ncbi:MAG: caspase family protein [Albidovulum sp.]|uniref:caspase family protein n=1 Tax=Albidovulum sp. TaxID=1872424 RepID=UPI003C953D07